MFDGIEMDLNSFPFLWPFPNSYLIASHFLVSTKGKNGFGQFWAIKVPWFLLSQGLGGKIYVVGGEKAMGLG